MNSEYCTTFEQTDKKIFQNMTAISQVNGTPCSYSIGLLYKLTPNSKVYKVSQGTESRSQTAYYLGTIFLKFRGGSYHYASTFTVPRG